MFSSDLSRPSKMPFWSQPSRRLVASPRFMLCVCVWQLTSEPKEKKSLNPPTGHFYTWNSFQSFHLFLCVCGVCVYTARPWQFSLVMGNTLRFFWAFDIILMFSSFINLRFFFYSILMFLCSFIRSQFIQRNRRVCLANTGNRRRRRWTITAERDWPFRHGVVQFDSTVDRIEDDGESVADNFHHGVSRRELLLLLSRWLGHFSHEWDWRVDGVA